MLQKQSLLVYVLTVFGNTIDYEWERSYYFSSQDKAIDYINHNTFCGADIDDKANLKCVRLDTQEELFSTTVKVSVHDSWDDCYDEEEEEVEKIPTTSPYAFSNELSPAYLKVKQREMDELWDEHEHEDELGDNLSDAEISNILYYRDRDIDL